MLLIAWFCREDYLKALKALFREIVRVLRFEIDFVSFCRGLMQERNDSYFTDLDQTIKVIVVLPFSILCKFKLFNFFVF